MAIFAKKTERKLETCVGFLMSPIFAFPKIGPKFIFRVRDNI